MNADYAMDDASAVDSRQYAQQISTIEYDRQAKKFTKQEVERLNAAVRAQPKLGARSEFFQDEENVVKGLPVFQGKHMRFLYDDEEEILAAIDVTQEALDMGPVVRTVAELGDDEEEEEDYDEENDEERNQDVTMQNTVHNSEGDMAMGDAHVSGLMQDVEIRVASMALSMSTSY